MCRYYVKNVVYSSKPRAEMDGEATFVDSKNLLQGVIHFGATPNLKRTDAVWGGIYRVEPAPRSVSVVCLFSFFRHPTPNLKKTDAVWGGTYRVKPAPRSEAVKP